MADIKFVDGLIAKRNANAPDYAIVKLAVKKSELFRFSTIRRVIGSTWKC